MMKLMRRGQPKTFSYAPYCFVSVGMVNHCNEKSSGAVNWEMETGGWPEFHFHEATDGPAPASAQAAVCF